MATMKQVVVWRTALAVLLLVLSPWIGAFVQAADVVRRPKATGPLTQPKSGIDVVTKVKADTSVLIDDRVTALEKEMRRQVKSMQTEIEALKAENAKQGELIKQLLRPGATRNRTAMWITKANWNNVDDSALMLFWVAPR